MENRNKEKQIMRVLSKPMQRVLFESKTEFEKLQEIRIRQGKPLILLGYDGEYEPASGRYVVTKEDVREVLDYISHYSLYAFENELRQGFITIEGGHRVGIAGKTIIDNGRIMNMKYITSVNIRVSHEIQGCADEILPLITWNKQIYHTLIISPPRCGKTTILRDLIRQISNGNAYVRGCSVGVVDERSELGGCYMGTVQNDLGVRTDILDCCPKAEGMIMLIRSMAPQVIAVDEIGSGDEVHAVEYAMHCGCRMLATVHGESMEELRKKPLFEQMIRERRFERYVVLSGRHQAGTVEGIYDERGTTMYQGRRAQRA